MQKYGFSMTDKGTTAVPSTVGGFYLVSDVEEMVDRLLKDKNARIAELEKALRDIVSADESDDTYPSSSAQIEMRNIAERALGITSYP